MARAHSIFIVRNVYHRNIVGMWTVKRELSEWVANQVDSFVIHHEVIRMRDGKPNHETLVPWEEIL